MSLKYADALTLINKGGSTLLFRQVLLSQSVEKFGSARERRYWL